MASAEQVRQLALALDPTRLVVALSVDGTEAPSARLRGLARAAEWLAHEAQSKTLLVVPESWRGRAELDHVTYGEQVLRTGELERLGEWLAAERPVSRMSCFVPAVQALLRALEARTSRPAPFAEPADEPEAPPAVAETTLEPPTSAAVIASKKQRAGAEKVSSRGPAPNALLPIGRRFVANEPAEEVGITLERLPYHTCVFAGSGSGKTVFLKRVIEEAALLGVPSIVLDGANDLSRLGAPWPERPPGLSDADLEKARRYHAASEVVVWTPGAPKGNPMRLSPLPDFASSSFDPAERDDELRAAVEIATTSIADLVVSDALQQLLSDKGTRATDVAR